MNVEEVIERESEIKVKRIDFIHIRRDLMRLDLTESVVDSVEKIGVNADAIEILTFVVEEKSVRTSQLGSTRDLKITKKKRCELIKERNTSRKKETERERRICTQF